MVTTTLPPNTHWKELLQALRIKYQSKAPYDVLMSQFYSTKMDTSEDCASFGIRLEQKLNQVTLQYPDKIYTESYWNHVKDRFFHGLSPIMKANLRTEFQSGSDYYKLLDIARKIEAENVYSVYLNKHTFVSKRQNSISNTIWWGKPYNFNLLRFWAKNQSLLKFTIGLLKFAKVPT